MIDSSHYESIHTYLLTHGQQELAGHLDNLWQEVLEYRPTESDVTPLEEGQTPEPNKPRGDGLS